MKKLLFLVLFLAVASLCQAQIKAVTETGDEVLLQYDGTWKYQKSNDIKRMEITTNSKVFKKDDSSTFLVKSENLNIGFWINPKKWSFKKSGSDSKFEYNFQLKNGDLYGMVVTEKVEIPLVALRDIVLENAEEAMPDIKIVKEEYRNINGLNVLSLKMNGMVDGIKLTYFGYYYSNANGTVQFITCTSQKLMDEYLMECEKLLNGLVETKK